MKSLLWRNKRAILKTCRVLITLATVGLIAYLLWSSRRDIVRSISGIAFWRLLIACGLIMVSRFAVAGRWHVLLRSVGIRIPYWESLRLTFAGLFATNFLPTTVGGDIVRLAGAAKLRCDTARYAASLIMDRIVGMAGMAVTLVIGLPICLHVLRPEQSVGTVPVGLSVAQISPPRKGRRRIVRRLFYALAKGARSPRALLGAFVLTWVHMLCLFAIMSVLLDGMGEGMSFLVIGGLWSVVYFVNLMPISINGLGVQELSIAFVFTRVGGISHAAGLTLAVLMRTLVMFGSLPGAAFVPSLMPDVRGQEPTEIYTEEVEEDNGEQEREFRERDSRSADSDPLSPGGTA